MRTGRAWSSVEERRRADDFFGELLGRRHGAFEWEAFAEHQTSGAAVLTPGRVGPPVDGRTNTAAIALVSPSGAIEGADTAAAITTEITSKTPRFVTAFSTAGHTVRFDLAPGEPSPPHVSAAYRLAGTDFQRTESLRWGLFGTRTQAAMAIRGGHGATRILDDIAVHVRSMSLRLRHELIDFATLFPAKRIIGYSDFTAVLLAVYNLLGWASLHGPMLVSSGGAAGRTSLVRALTLAPRDLYPGNLVQAGLGLVGPAPTAPVRGVMLGGNLALVDALYGSPFFPSLQGGILFVEETNEEGRKIDRMIEGLKHRGAASQVRAVVVGRTSNIGSNAVAQLFRASWGVPCVSGLTAGHDGANPALWIGLEYELRFPAAGGASLYLRP